MKNRGVRLAMIGIDALSLDFVRSSSVPLPNLRALAAQRGLRPLRSTAELLAGSVWPSFAAAQAPGHHGIYHHLQWDPARMELRRVTSDWLPFVPFWSRLEEMGRKVICVDVPMVFPSLKNGVEVINWGSHDQLGSPTTRPFELRRDIQKRFGRMHPMGFEIPVTKGARELERIKQGLVAGAATKGDLCAWLMRNFEWDFFLAVFGECHRGGHILWPDGGLNAPPSSMLEEVYQAVDRALGRVLAELRAVGAPILVFALHGMGPNTSQEHFVPKVMDRVNSLFAGAAGPKANAISASTPPAAEQRSTMRWLRESLPPGLQNRIARAVPVWARDFVVSRAVTSGHKWETTPAFALLADLHGYIRFNLRGRERYGSVDPPSTATGGLLGRYSELLSDSFFSLHTPEGARLVRDIRFLSRDYPGPRVSYLPDVVVTWNECAPASRIVSDSLGVFESQIATGRSGNHRPDGFYVFAGDPGVDAQFEATDIDELGTLVMQRFGAESVYAASHEEWP